MKLFTHITGFFLPREKNFPLRRRFFVSCFVPLFIFLLSDCKTQKQPQVTLRGDRFDSVRVLIEKTIKKNSIPSVAIAAAQDGKIVWEEAFGWADWEKEIPATPNSMYALASITKSFTAVGIMKLVEGGLINLDDPVNKYLGDAKLISYVGSAEEATVRQVMQFRAGLPAHYNIFFGDRQEYPPEQDESIRRYGIIAEQPGREYMYSNFAYGILDRVISNVSRKPYGDFMKTEIFHPLGLNHTSVLIDSTLQSFSVQHYDRRNERVPGLDFDHRGASAIYSSVHDLIRYGMFLLKDSLPGQEKVLSESAIDSIQHPSDFHVPGEDADTRVGLGCALVDLQGIRFILVTGGMPGTTTRLALIPEKNAVVAILTNKSINDNLDLWKIEWETFTALIPGFPQRPDPAPPARERTPLPAEYYGDWTGSIKTYEREIPAKLTLHKGEPPLIEIDGEETRMIRDNNPLGSLTYNNGWLEAPFFGTIPTNDCQRARHVVYLRLRVDHNALRGIAAAIAIDESFWLPHWISLTRVTNRE